MTKELEAKYGIKIFEQEQSVNSEPDEKDVKSSPDNARSIWADTSRFASYYKQAVEDLDRTSESNQQTLTTNLDLETAHLTLESFRLPKGDETPITNDQVEMERSPNGATSSDFKSSYMAQSKPLKSSTEGLDLGSQNDLFSSRNGRFFQFNRSNKFFKQVSASIDRLENSKGAFSFERQNETASVIEEEKIGRNEKPMIALLGSKDRIVQPEYMKAVGSMCVTELWSKKATKQYLKTMQTKSKPIKIMNQTREFESLYRPDRWKEEEKVKAMMQRRDFSFTLQQVMKREEEKDQRSQEQLKKNLPVLKKEMMSKSFYQGVSRPKKETSFSLGGSSSKNTSILAKILKSETLKKGGLIKKEDEKHVVLEENKEAEGERKQLTKTSSNLFEKIKRRHAH